MKGLSLPSHRQINFEEMYRLEIVLGDVKI